MREGNTLGVTVTGGFLAQLQCGAVRIFPTSMHMRIRLYPGGPTSACTILYHTSSYDSLVCSGLLTI